MAQWDEKSVAAELLACEAERRDREPFTDEWPELDVDTGYRIQDANLQVRLARGEKLVGVKLGLTSEAKQKRMGVYAPFVAWLTDAMLLEAGKPVPQDKLIHPRIEPEIIFIMKDRLEGPRSHPGVRDGRGRQGLRRLRDHRLPVQELPLPRR